jgi:hypothetical protein
MLPNVFRPDSPALALQLPLETEQALEALLAKLPATVFQADDSLGWSYQFWQAPKKQEVQRQMKQAGTKVGADELPAVTQLFTEQYMVAFLLENALGGWWQGRHPEQPLPVAMLPTSAEVNDGTPAAGTFPAWPASLAQFKLLDPCLGSGHFLVSALHYLVPMRCATEKLSVRAAIDCVLRRQPARPRTRCPLRRNRRLRAGPGRLALSRRARPAARLPPAATPQHRLRRRRAAQQESRLAQARRWRHAARRRHGRALRPVPESPGTRQPDRPDGRHRGDLLDAQWEELESRLEQALAGHDDDADIEARVAAQGMVHASRILTRQVSPGHHQSALSRRRAAWPGAQGFLRGTLQGSQGRSRQCVSGAQPQALCARRLRCRL